MASAASLENDVFDSDSPVVGQLTIEEVKFSKGAGGIEKSLTLHEKTTVAVQWFKLQDEQSKADKNPEQSVMIRVQIGPRKLNVPIALLSSLVSSKKPEYHPTLAAQHGSQSFLKRNYYLRCTGNMLGLTRLENPFRSVAGDGARKRQSG